MDGIATTGLSNGVWNNYTVMAQAKQVYKSGTPKGGAGEVWGTRTGGGSVPSTKSVFEYVYGFTWRLDTRHAVTGNGANWWPTQTIFATP